MLRIGIGRRLAQSTSRHPCCNRIACDMFPSLLPITRSHSTKPQTPRPLTELEIDDLLASPVWDAADLTRSNTEIAYSDEASSEELRTVLRLCALPLPSSPEHEKRLLESLNKQLQFVRDVQNAPSADVAPLQVLRDETVDALSELQAEVSSLQSAFDAEETHGSFHRRFRRKPDISIQVQDTEKDWDALSLAPKRVGRFVVVEERN